MTQLTQTTQAKLQGLLVARAQADPEFRAQLVADPKATIGALVGSEVPKEVAIQVHEESATTFHLVLPLSGELREDELDAAFAGCTWYSTCDEVVEISNPSDYNWQ